ncbi:MAG: cardiolipin synthase ClsB [Undibacterium sp.]|nr:cardiolipin synthase ClsB [Undibacterium sp.]
MAKLDYIGGNQLQILHNGEQFFASLKTAIDNAKQSIFLETYIFADDRSAQQIQTSLCLAAQRGVKVHVIIDWVGCGNALSKQHQAQFETAGVACRIFNPWFKRGLARMHRKLSVIDQEIAYVGGINVIDDYLPDHSSEEECGFPRWDFAVQIRGNLVSKIFLESAGLWARLGKLRLLTRLRLARDLRLASPIQIELTNPAALVVRDNLRNRNTIQKAYLKALGNATLSATLANPYFAPGRKIRNGLISAAKRGVKVSLLLGVGEFAWQDAVAQSYYPKLLAHGVQIYEYRKAKLHAKVAVIDQWATVGSSNIDGLSLFINHEANLVVRDGDFAAQLSAHLSQGILDAVQIDEQSLIKRSWFNRQKIKIAYYFYRGIMQIATFGQYR